MKALTQLGFLRMGTRQGEAFEEDGRVLALFRNRAELKKAYGELQDEVWRLKDRIKQQEGATARVQEMLAALEGRLGVVETGYPALVFYQLRAIWQLGREQIEQFVSDLVRQQEERERRAHVAEFNRRQFTRRQSVERDLRAAETYAAETRQKLSELEAARGKLTRLWHYFKRRDLDDQLYAARADVRGSGAALEQARASLEALDQENAGPFEGLSIEARRAINLAAISYGEALCLRLIETPLVTLAKEAMARREVADDYGSRSECELLIAQIARARTVLLSKANVAQDVKTRTERLKQVARYRNPPDTVPTAESLAFSEGDVLAGQSMGKFAARMPNVLAEDTWDLFRVLLR